MYICMYVWEYAIPSAFFTAALQHFIVCCKESFCCNAGDMTKTTTRRLIYHEIERASVPGKWLRPNHVRYIPRTTGSILSTQEILDPSVHYPVLYHHLESSSYQMEVWYTMNYSKSQCTRNMAMSLSRTVHSKTHGFCPIQTRNIRPIGQISSTIPSPWIQPLPRGSSHMQWMIRRATVPG